MVKEGKIKRSKKSAKTSDTPHYGNVPFEIPDNWVWCRLEDIANIGTGATPNRLNKEYYNNGIIPWINSSSTNCTYITEASEYITEKAINETNCKIYPIGTLIVAMYGEGKTRGQVSELLIESATNQACAAISLIDTNIKAYIKNYFEGNYFHLRKLAEGGNQPNLSIGKISNYTIPLPPLSEQHRITTEIEKCFSIIDIIECGKADLQTAIKQAKSKILDLAIHGKLVPQDPNDEPAIELLKRINPDFTPCDNGHYAQLPDGWCAVALKDLCENINGLWKGKKEPFVNVGVIRNANFTKDFKLDYSNIEYIDVEQRTFAKRHLENGDLIVEKSGGSDNNPVGRTILYEGKSGVFSFSNFTMALRTRNSDIVLSKFLYYYILAKYQKGDMRLMQTQTTGLRNLILDKFLSMPIHLPPLSEQKRIIDRIETIFTSLDMIMGSL